MVPWRVKGVRALAIGEGVRRRVHEATGGLTVSIGIAPNKFLAKLASDLDKPDGMTVVDPDGIQELLDPLPVKKIWGVGPRMTEALHEIGLKTIQDLRKGGVDLLQRRFGENSAHRLWNLAHGRDERGFGDRSPAKSISTENTFSKDISRGPASDRFLRKIRKFFRILFRVQGSGFSLGFRIWGFGLRVRA